MHVELVLPQNETRGWHLQLISRLGGAGHTVSVQVVRATKAPLLLDWLLGIEQTVLLRRNSALLARQRIDAASHENAADLRIDVSGVAPPSDIPTLRIATRGGRPLMEAATLVAHGELPSVQLTLDGRFFDVAHPMIDNRFSLTRGLEDVLARTISLLLKGVERVRLNKLSPRHPDAGEIDPPTSVDAAPLGSTYAFRLLPRLLREMYRRATSKTHAHWCVGFRLIDGAGVAENSDLSGPAWTRIPDCGSRFYADPFPFSWQGRHYIFVEDYEHSKGKGIISVSEINADGTATRPMPVLEEDYHLSYPNVFQHGGDIWMLPESGASRNLVLYRASNFPFEWERHRVLIEDRELADPTLLEQDGRLWLFAAERDGAGSAADMMSVFYADGLHEPWRPHPANPVSIDRAGARPGGNIIRSGGRLLLPVQDCTETYGGALGLSEIVRITETEIEVAEATPIRPDGDWPYPRIHTLNRAGRLEVIDGIVP